MFTVGVTYDVFMTLLLGQQYTHLFAPYMSLPKRPPASWHWKVKFNDVQICSVRVIDSLISVFSFSAKIAGRKPGTKPSMIISFSKTTNSVN